MDRVIGTAASTEAAHVGDHLLSPSTEPILDALPEVYNSYMEKDLQSGVSTRNVSIEKPIGSPDVDEVKVRWYALRATFGKERDAYEYINEHSGMAYCPRIKNMKMVKGKRKKVEEAYIPNLLFAYGSIENLKTFVYDNINLPYLRFYEGYREVCGVVQKRPLFIPDKEMEYLKKVCEAEAGGAFIPADKTRVFKAGDMVRVKKGNKFEGIEGRVARYKGQQCVAVIVNGLLTFATAYIPSYQLEKI